jgi:predicted  nucleic acid-binding Zn-ribbon protein
VPRAAAKPARPAPAAVTSTPKASVRQRAGTALLEASAMESVLDRILVKRLRPLRADTTAARKAFEQQVVLRVEAETRAVRLEEEAQQLRLQVQQLEQELAGAQQRRSSWFRRRSTSVRMQEA